MDFYNWTHKVEGEVNVLKFLPSHTSTDNQISSEKGTKYLEPSPIVSLIIREAGINVQDEINKFLRG